MMYDIRLDGDTRAMLRRIRGFSEIDRRSINAALAEGVRESTLERFRQSKAPDGRRWRTSIRAAQEGGRTLIQTAQLRSSIHSRADASGFAVGTNVKHAATHQFGEPGRTIRARRKKALRFQVGGKWISKKQVRITIPARPFLGLSDEDMQEMKATVEDFIGREN
ncbi:MAG: phage morphogenesis protein [Oscillibacter sp.]|nr:phage morphogenesis protein [Oscillibacter sp.]